MKALERILRPTLLAIVVLLLATGQAIACSCGGWQSVLEARDASTVVIVGVTGERDGATWPVHVERWILGSDPRQELRITDLFGSDEAACQVAGPPSAGVAHVFVVSLKPSDDRFGIGLCTPVEPSASAEGRAIIARAEQLAGLPPTEVVSTEGNGPHQDPLPLMAVLALAAGATTLLFLRRRSRVA